MDTPTSQVMAQHKVLVVGIANEHSIAYGCARAFRELGAELAITYLNEKAKAYVEPVPRFEVPLASGAGKSAPIVGLDGASFTRKYLPGDIKHGPGEQRGVTDQLVPVADACCTDHPVRSTVVVPRLNNSMKSFL